MTTTTTTEAQQVAAVTQPPVQTPSKTQQLLQLIAAALVLYGTYKAAAAALKAAFLPFKVGVEALEAAIKIAMALSYHLGTGVWTTVISVEVTPELLMRRQVTLYRAAYVKQAAQRIQQDLDAGVSLEEATRKEARFAQMHLYAQQARVAAAKQVQAAQKRYGDILGWYSVMDSRTSPECAAANGHNFSALKMPVIGYPGAVHPRCRCHVGPKHQSTLTVDEAIWGFEERTVA